MNLAKYIDHTLLKPDATFEQIKTLCEEATTYQFYSVCVNPAWVKTAKQLLKGSDVKVCTVVGFPLGASTTETKVFETKNAIENGADEIDMVINIGAFKSGEASFVQREIENIVEATKKQAIVKVIIETGLLSDDEIKKACSLVERAQANFVKTSTGFTAEGAKLEHILLMKSVVEDRIGIKASGGIRSLEFAKKLIQAGATRIGSSQSVALVQSENE